MLSATEKQYLTSIVLASTAMLMHSLPYPRFAWTETREYGQHHPLSNGRIPLCFRMPRFLVYLVPPAFFGVFAYGFPFLLLTDGLYCGRGADARPSDCEAAEDAGGAPFLFVFGSTVLMWVFDAIGCHVVGLIKREDPARRKISVMLGRFGLTLLYCGLVCFAGSFKVRIDIELEGYNSEDTKHAKIGFVNCQERAGIISFVLAAILWATSLLMCRQKGAVLSDNHATAVPSSSSASHRQQTRLDDVQMAHTQLDRESLAEKLEKYRTLLERNALCEKKLKEAADDPGLRQFDEAVTASDLAAFVHVRTFTNITKRGMFPEKGTQADAAAGKHCLVAMAFACKDQPVVLSEPRVEEV